MNLFEEIFNKAQQLNDRLVDWRRTIHRHPELGLQEVRTAHFVSDTLASFGIRCQSVARTGLVALIRGSGERTVALRADMDALPIQEENTAEYRSSVEGVMHACGHDGHVAMLIGAAVILNNLGIRLPGGVKLIFQPAEEQSFVREGGGREMIQNGVLDSPTVASIVGLHLDPELPPGTVGVKDGPLMATSTVLEITVRGRSAHGARPHEGVDAIYAASQIVLSLQALISRETNAVDAKVVTIGEISGGTSPNVIAGQVLLRGTMRAFSNETMEGLEALVIERCCKVAEAFGASADVTLLRLYPPLVNHTEITNMIREAGMLCPWIREIREIPTPGMGGDDFAFYTQQIPGAMFRLGSALSNRKTKLHTPTFDFDESVLTFGTALLAVIAVKMLALDTRI